MGVCSTNNFHNSFFSCDSLVKKEKNTPKISTTTVSGQTVRRTRDGQKKGEIDSIELVMAGGTEGGREEKLIDGGVETKATQPAISPVTCADCSKGDEFHQSRCARSAG